MYFILFGYTQPCQASLAPLKTSGGSALIDRKGRQETDKKDLPLRTDCGGGVGSLFPRSGSMTPPHSSVISVALGGLKWVLRFEDGLGSRDAVCFDAQASVLRMCPLSWLPHKAPSGPSWKRAQGPQGSGGVSPPALALAAGTSVTCCEVRRAEGSLSCVLGM